LFNVFILRCFATLDDFSKGVPTDVPSPVQSSLGHDDEAEAEPATLDSPALMIPPQETQVPNNQ